MTRAATRRAKANPVVRATYLAGFVDMSCAKTQNELRTLHETIVFTIPVETWTTVVAPEAIAVHGINAIVLISKTEGLTNELLAGLACRVADYNHRDDRLYTLVFTTDTAIGRLIKHAMPFLTPAFSIPRLWSVISSCTHQHLAYMRAHADVPTANEHAAYIACAFLAAFNTEVTDHHYYYHRSAQVVLAGDAQANLIVDLNLHADAKIREVFCKRQAHTAFLSNPIAHAYFAVVAAAIAAVV